MPRKKTNEEFLKEVHNLVQDEYIFLEEYVNARTKIKVKHNKCNNVYSVTPKNFLYGKRCPKCAYKIKSQKRTKTNEQFLAEVDCYVGNEYTVLEKYINSYTPIKFKHNKCGHTFKMQPHNFLSGQGCPKCGMKSRIEHLTKRHKQVNTWYGSNIYTY